MLSGGRQFRKSVTTESNQTYYEVKLLTKFRVSLRFCDLIPASWSKIGRKYVIRPFPLSWPADNDEYGVSPSTAMLSYQTILLLRGFNYINDKELMTHRWGWPYKRGNDLRGFWTRVWSPTISLMIILLVGTNFTVGRSAYYRHRQFEFFLQFLPSRGRWAGNWRHQCYYGIWLELHGLALTFRYYKAIEGYMDWFSQSLRFGTDYTRDSGHRNTKRTFNAAGTI